MSDTAAHHAHQSHASHYIKIWGILLALLVVSVVGPMFGIKVLTLITAFGIAGVKAYMVAKNFMHINMEPKYIGYLVVVCVGLMVLFFFGVSPDVMKHDGHHWKNVAAVNGDKPEPAHHEGGHEAGAAAHGAEGAAHGAEGAAPAHGAEGAAPAEAAPAEGGAK